MSSLADPQLISAWRAAGISQMVSNPVWEPSESTPQPAPVREPTESALEHTPTYESAPPWLSLAPRAPMWWSPAPPNPPWWPSLPSVCCGGHLLHHGDLQFSLSGCHGLLLCPRGLQLHIFHPGGLQLHMLRPGGLQLCMLRHTGLARHSAPWSVSGPPPSWTFCFLF